MFYIASRVEVEAPEDVPFVSRGDDVGRVVTTALERLSPAEDGDVLVVTSKIVSRAEGRFVDLKSVTPSAKAHELAAATKKDPRLVELILSESVGVSRALPNVLIVRHRLGFVTANAGIDASNVGSDGVLLLPVDPDASAQKIRDAVERATGKKVGVILSDSHGRPFRLGTVGIAIGVAGVPALWDRRGEPDLHGRKLEHTIAALADPIAGMADLVAGQAAEARPIVRFRGIRFEAGEHSAKELVRRPEEDLYA